MNSIRTRKRSWRLLGAGLLLGTVFAPALAAHEGRAGESRPTRRSANGLELRTSEERGGRYLEISGGDPFELVRVWIGARAGVAARGLSLVGTLHGSFGLDGDGELALELPRDIAYDTYDIEGGPWAQVQRGGLRSSWSLPLNLGWTEQLGPGGVQRGSVVITEFMKDPTFVSDTDGEWIEFFNPHTRRINLEGMVLSDGGSNSHTINNGGNGLFLRPGRYMVMGNNADPLTNGGVPIRYRYTSFTLNNTSDSIILTAANGTVIDRVDYDDGVLWPDTSGSSISLDPAIMDVMDNDDPANWCHSTSFIGPSNFDTGTPRAVNDLCL